MTERAMFAAIYIPDFSTEAILRMRPELRHGALAVVEGIPPLSYVISMNARARELGISVGMPKVQAESFVMGRGVVAERDALAEKSAHAALLDAADAISPKVEDTAQDVAVLDATGLEKLFGTPRQVARELARRVADHGLEANIAMASNADNAEHTARGFQGVTVLERAGETERVGTLPLEVLFAAEASAVARGRNAGGARFSQDERRKMLERLARMQETFDRWGVRNFRALASLPATSLSERMGQTGVRLQKLAAGAVRRELVQREPEMIFEEALELESAVENIEPLMFLLGRMLEQLCARLGTRSLCTHELRLRLQLERHAADEVALTAEELAEMGNGAVTERKLTLPVAMNDAKLFLKLLHLQLSARQPGAPVTKLWLRAEPARPRAGQAGLFMPLSPEPEKLELTLARIHKLLSAMPKRDMDEDVRAGCAAMVDSHQPGIFRMTRFAAEEKDGETPESRERTSMALRRMRPPAEVEVEMRDGHPARIVAECIGAKATRNDNVLWAAGPWRNSGNWWLRGEVDEKHGDEKMEPWTRDEWDVAIGIPQQKLVGDGPLKKAVKMPLLVALYRIAQETESGRWFIEGSYD